MFKRFNTLKKYLAREKWPWLLGTICLIAANILEVRVSVLLGNGVDLAGFNLGPWEAMHDELLWSFVGTVLIIGIAAGFARFLMRHLIIGSSRHIEFNLRNDLLAHLQKLPAKFYDRFRTGDIINRSTGDMDAIRMVIGPALMYTANTLTIVPLATIKMLQLSPVLAIICWMPMFMIAPLVLFFSRRIHHRSRHAQELLSDVSTNVQETLSGVRVLKVFAAEKRTSENFDGLSKSYVDANMKLALLQAMFMPLMFTVVGLTVALLVWRGSAMMIAGTISQGTLVTFFLLLMSCIWPIAAFGWVFAIIERGAASMARVDELLAVQPEETEENTEIELPARINGKIELRDLTFTYPQAGEPALKNINLTIEPGETLGITGPVGCGKTTLVALLAKRYDLDPGMLFIDGIDLHDWPQQDLRRHLGIVDQEPFIFSDSIRENILFGVDGTRRNGKRSDDSSGDLAPLPADEDRIQLSEHAARIAQVDGEIAKMPNGYETILGERGLNLSGGQRQRTALARAIARRPSMLLLDDALSAVDTHTEEAILGGLRELLGECTTLIISHRITTVSLADRIIYLDHGELVEQGTHTELMEAQGQYYNLSRKQQLAAEIEETA